MYSRNELKIFIENTLIGKQKAIPYNRQIPRWYELRDLMTYYNSIFDNTNYLPETAKFNERCFQIIHDLFKIQYCSSCETPVNYASFVKGYNLFCEGKCATKGKKQSDTFIKKFGIDEGTKRYEIMIKNKTQTEERFIELYGEKEGKQRWASRNKKCKDNISLIGFINRYGKEEGKIKYIEFRQKLKFSSTCEGKIEKYGEEKGLEIYNETIKKKAQTLDRFIEIYGEEDGIKNFEMFIQKRSANSNIMVSKESLDFFEPLLDHLLEKAQTDEIISNTYIGKKSKQEYFLIDTELNKTYFYDFTIEPLKLIFEYNGSMFHPNKNKLTESEWNIWKTPFTNIGADEKFIHDKRKIKIAELNGFEIMEIWDTDDKELSLEKCKIIIGKKLEEYYNDKI